ncbi:hypothetical protein [Cedecea sp.]|jgi:hypothetical protein|uniref:hypothetical protein n=1 Tax=Cedecea sp. TaxID=1970739 RepID=UPI002F3F0F59
MSKSDLAAFIESKSSRGKKRTPLYGHGIYDADFPSHVMIGKSMVSHPAYSVWHSMLARCYSEKRQMQNPSYIGCSVSSEWHFFSEFLQFYRGSFHDGYHLDKDLLVIGNRTYSSQRCVFIPRYINNFTTASNSARGALPQGVCFDKNRGLFMASISIDSRRKLLGHFRDPFEAHLAWHREKMKKAISMKDECDVIHPLLHQGIVTKIESMLELQQ